MPQIMVTAEAHEQDHDGVMLRERVNIDDFESERFAANLIERLGWAVIDATEAERAPAPAPETKQTGEHPRPPRTREERTRAPDEFVHA